MFSRAAKDTVFNDVLRAALSSFRCAQDKDIEMFLQDKAEDFIKRKLCHVYLLLNEESFRRDELKIEGYFTLSSKSLVAEQISRSKVKKFTSGNSKAETINFVLIGQLGKRVELKDGKYIRSDLKGTEILDFAFEVIREIDAMLPCKVALVECGDEEKIRGFYEGYGFSFLQNDGTHNQYTKLI